MTSFWQGKKVLVTGCSGLIGGALCQKLLTLGASLQGYDKELGTLIERRLNHQFPIIFGDILDAHDVARSMEGITHCFHLAAISGVEQSRKDPLKTWEVNVRGTWIVLDAAREQGIEHTITASSNHIYGAQKQYPVAEDAPMNQLDTYSATKIAADVLARSYAHNYDMPVSVVRNTNCFGPHDPHDDHIIPGTILSLLREEAPTIWTNGLTWKSYLHVDDVADAYLKIGELRGTGEAYNVAGPRINTLLLVDIIKELMGSTLKPVVLHRIHDQADESLDSSKVHSATGWEPQIPLQVGLKETIDWFHARAEVPV
jgi:CDP-glucose 4,6-dehydratase